MKFVFLFFIVVFFAPSPALEAMGTPVETGVFRGHGIVGVTQGRTHISVHVEGEGLVEVQLLTMEREAVAYVTCVGSGTVLFSKATLPVGRYVVQVWIAGKVVDEVEIDVV